MLTGQKFEANSKTGMVLVHFSVSDFALDQNPRFFACAN